ncbi:capsular polysaccharide transport system permease protein [Aliiroseovarius halocynthiae]|uniref:Capsule biosynthesis protein n=1 Tax=Aliiroseovarius halocynthiae TaxID=985055 RepID=A0A545SM34_9RHOB|nr:capsule biosynthesis protein [Aliiroseovarius halocynthiae]TQV66035.1 capsule biosynthesis protein [Aliiroseovarius halocynthiae]SMR83257.1 capsular polysaccharide transport system permease protein [Aliiroseovarius halocynthiae]
MTTKPKVSRYRIRRGSEHASATEQAASEASQETSSRKEAELNPLEQMAAVPQEDGLPPAAGKSAMRIERNTRPSGATDADANPDEIAQVQNEGLTGRQLRMARRVAQKHGVQADNDYDAVIKLRRAGIDPFKRANMLELVEGEGDGKSTNLPQPAPQVGVPGPGVFDAAARARSVIDIQRDIARRRRRNLQMLILRLIFFVVFPTIAAGYYYYNVATPMYATKSEFVIQQADGSGGGASGLFAGTGLASSQDSIGVQGYLTSREAMLRLDRDVGFKDSFSDPSIDVVQRLDQGASNETAYKAYRKRVKIGFDPTEGIIKMEVVAPSPKLSELYSKALISYAEERVDNLTQRKREDQMEGAQNSYEEAEREMLAAQGRVLALQEEVGVFDATSDASSLMSQINTYELQLQDKRLRLQQLLDNTSPNQARVDGVRGDISRLESLIAELRGRLTDTGGEKGSLASISGQLRIAQTNLETRTLLMQQALQQLEVARIEANKQTRYLSTNVSPVAPDQPTYPKAFENTLLAFLIFSGIYLMLSLTASILREQISS